MNEVKLILKLKTEQKSDLINKAMETTGQYCKINTSKICAKKKRKDIQMERSDGVTWNTRTPEV